MHDINNKPRRPLPDIHPNSLKLGTSPGTSDEMIVSRQYKLAQIKNLRVILS